MSFRDGGKYNYSKTEQQRLREASDRLCREYGLSVIEKPDKAPSRPVWLDEKNGKPTRYNVYRADVQEAMNFSRTPYYMRFLCSLVFLLLGNGKHTTSLPQSLLKHLLFPCLLREERVQPSQEAELRCHRMVGFHTIRAEPSRRFP